jgi:uncharacterized protein YhaN
MMTKAEVTAFLTSLTRSPKSEGDAPCVITVRATRSTKAFIAESLERLDEITDVLRSDGAAARAASHWDNIEQHFQQLDQQARRLELPNIASAARHAELFTAVIGSRMQRSLAEPSSLQQLTALLSAMLLRLYVDGNDERCVPELRKIQDLVQRSARTMQFPTSPAPASVHTVN